MLTRAAATEKPCGIWDFFSGSSRARGCSGCAPALSCLEAAWVAALGGVPLFVRRAGEAVITGCLKAGLPESGAAFTRGGRRPQKTQTLGRAGPHCTTAIHSPGRAAGLRAACVCGAAFLVPDVVLCLLLGGPRHCRAG